MCVQCGSDPREIRIKEDGKKRTTKTQSNKQTKNPESKQTNKQQQQQQKHHQQNHQETIKSQQTSRCYSTMQNGDLEGRVLERLRR